MKNRTSRLIAFAIFGVALLCASLILMSLINTGLLAVDPISAFARISLGGNVVLEIGNNDYGHLAKYNKIVSSLKSITPPGIETYNSAFSPDGGKIALVFRKSDETGYHIGLLDIDTGDITTLIDNHTNVIGINAATSIAWSSDGSKLLASLVSNGNCFKLVVFNLADLSHSIANPRFCESDTGLPVDKLDVSWSPGESPLIGVRYRGGFNNVYILSKSMSELSWIAHGVSPAWRPNTKDVTYICEAPSTGVSSLCLYSLVEKAEKYMVEKFSEQSYEWSSDGRFILFIDQGGESDPTYISLLDVASGQRIHLHVLSNHAASVYRNVLWVTK